MIPWTLRICAVIATLVCFVAAWDGFKENRSFSSHGQKALLEPIDGYTERTTTKTKLGVQVNQSKSHSARVAFTTQDTQRIEVNRDLPDPVLNALKARQEVYIEYLPEDPYRTRFVGYARAPHWVALFGLLLGAFTFFFWRKF
jgi:hypothetical protein